MDFTALSAITGGLKGAWDIGQAALQVRDAAKLSDAITEMQHKLIDAQQRLFAVGAEAMALQDELARTKEEALKLKTALQERGSYELVQLFGGQSAYKPKVEAGKDGGDGAEPPYYLCQRCFDAGTKVVLQPRFEQGQDIGLRCTNCNTTLPNQAGVAYTGRMQASATGRAVFPTL